MPEVKLLGGIKSIICLLSCAGLTDAGLGEPAQAQTASPSENAGVQTPRTDISVVRVTGASTSGEGSTPVTNVTPSATGSRDQALAVKRLAPNVIEVQPQSEIRKLPDVTVADAASRISVVPLETDTAEGRYINLGGLEANLNAVAFGGVKLVPTNPSAHSVAAGQSRWTRSQQA